METNKVRVETVPVIKITLDQMKHTVMQMLDPEIVREAIECRLENAIKQFNFNESVTRCAEECISKSITIYFSYGEGYEIIRKSVEFALQETLLRMGSQGGESKQQ